TATAPRLTAAYQPVSEVKSGSPAQFLLPLGGEGFDLRGPLGGPRPAPAGARVVASRLSDFQGDGFYAEVDGEGRFALRLPKADYVLDLEAEGYMIRPR